MDACFPLMVMGRKIGIHRPIYNKFLPEDFGKNFIRQQNIGIGPADMNYLSPFSGCEQRVFMRLHRPCGLKQHIRSHPIGLCHNSCNNILFFGVYCYINP